MLAAVVGALVLVPHLYVPHPLAAAMLERWKPLLVHDSILSVKGLRRFAKARIDLDEHGMGGLVSVEERPVFFVVHHPNALATVVQRCVWGGGDVCREAKFEALRDWHSHTFPDVALMGGEIEDDEDRALWMATE